MKVRKSKFRQVNIPDKCLHCNQPYKQKDIDVIREEGNLLVFHLTCSKCKISVILNMLAGKEGIFSVGTMTDIQKEDLSKIIESKPITADDVIKAHLFFTKKK